MYLETDGAQAWLYHCLIYISPHHNTNLCCDCVPILYGGTFSLLTSLTHTTNLPSSQSTEVFGSRKNFQSDLDQEISWYTLTNSFEHQDRPNFGTNEVTPVFVQLFPGFQDVALYHQSKINEMWEGIFISAASLNALQKLWPKHFVYIITKADPGSYLYAAHRTDFFVDDLISHASPRTNSWVL